MKAKVFISIMTIILVASAITGSTVSLFSRQVELPLNTLQAGKVSVQMLAGPALVELDRNNPGPEEIITFDFTLHNSGSIPMVLKPLVNEVSAHPLNAEVYLPRRLEITIEHQNQVVYESNFLALLEAECDQGWFKNGNDNLILAAGETIELSVSFKHDPASSSSARPHPWAGEIYFKAAQSNNYLWSTTVMPEGLE